MHERDILRWMNTLSTIYILLIVGAFIAVIAVLSFYIGRWLGA